MSHDEIVTRAARAVREVMERIQSTGAPPTASQIRTAVEAALAAESEELESLQTVVLEYVRRFKAAAAEMEDLQEIAAAWSSGRVHLPVTYDGLAAEDRRREVASASALIYAAGHELPELPETWPVVEAFCETALKAPASLAQERAAEAVRIARALPEAAETRNLLAYALAHQAHAYYRAGNLPRAGALFEEMEAAASLTGGGPEWDDDLEGYCPLSLLMKASYIRSTRRLCLALDHQISALGLLAGMRTRPPRPKLLAITLLSVAQSLYELGYAAPAKGVLQACQALQLYLDDELFGCLQHNLATASLALGDVAMANHVFGQLARPKLGRERTRVEWTRARIALAEGKKKQALVLLSQIREEFLRQNSRYDVGLISLELAEQYALVGDVEAVQRFAGEAICLFSAPGCEREHLVALGYLARAVAAQL